MVATKLPSESVAPASGCEMEAVTAWPGRQSVLWHTVVTVVINQRWKKVTRKPD